MKIWQKENSKKTDEIIESFTVGKDRELDVYLARFDLLGSMAHSIMLESIGLLGRNDLSSLLRECNNIYKNEIIQENFKISDGVEDIHSEIEYRLTQKLGDVGKKIHSGRSRNDQVLVDLKMYLRDEIEIITELIKRLFSTLQYKSEKHKNDLLPGYTHLQIAMPSSFGLWFGAYAESLTDDLTVLLATYKIINKNPLGSGAGYGSSFPLNRKLTTELLGFDDLNYNVVYAQMTRGKMEFSLAQSIAALSATIGRLAMDVCLYNSQNFGFLTLPEEMTTGSSIMPHKKNPDVAEILRGKANKLKSLPTEIAFIQSNLPSGYHREFQIIKEIIIPAIEEFKEMLLVSEYMVAHLEPTKDILKDPKFDLLFSVENVNKLVVQGIPFRDAYKEVGGQINEGKYKPEKVINHNLEGSIGNLCNSEIKNAFEKVLSEFQFDSLRKTLDDLLNYSVR